MKAGEKHRGAKTRGEYKSIDEVKRELRGIETSAQEAIDELDAELDRKIVEDPEIKAELSRKLDDDELNFLLELGKEYIQRIPPQHYDEMQAFLISKQAESSDRLQGEEAVIVDTSWRTEKLLSKPDDHGTSDVASTAAELAATHYNVYDFSSYDREELKRRGLRNVWLMEISPSSHSERRDRKAGTRSRWIDEASQGSWELAHGNDKIKVRGERHRADLTWVGKGLEAEGVVLFVDGVRIEVVELDLRADTNSMRLFFVLPDHAGEDVPLVRVETCLEDDGTVRVQLWTRKE